MTPHVLIPRRALLASALGLVLPTAAFAQCPPAEQIAKTMLDVFKRPIEVKAVAPAPLKGLCEVQVSFQGRPNILYTDATGAHFVTGHLIDTKTGTDITEVALGALNSLSQEDLKKVDSLVAFTVGTKGKPVYFVTDPM